MNTQQQLSVDAIRRGIASQRPELMGFRFEIAERESRVVLSAPNWPDIHVGIRGGIQVQVPSYPETGKPGETALDAAIWADKLLAKQRLRSEKRSTTRVIVSTPSYPNARVRALDLESATGPESWQGCAQRYLKQWCEQDRQLVHDFSIAGATCKLLNHLCNLYGVALTVPGHGLDKFRRFAEMLNAYRQTTMTRENVPVIIERGFADMRLAYGSSFLSAITKAFWMMKQHPVVIYDGNARKGLRRCGLAPGYDNYRVYLDSWFRFFDSAETQDGLAGALKWLPQSLYAQNLLNAGKIDATEFETIVESSLFRNRVSDMMLCYLGTGIVFFN